MVNKVNIKPAKHHHASMLTLEFGSKHLCAEVEPHRPANITVDSYYTCTTGEQYTVYRGTR